MDKKGFTFIELIVSITIMGLIVLMVSPAVIQIKKNITQKHYNSIVNTVLTAAKKYGRDNIVDLKSPVVSEYTNQTGKTNDCTVIKIDYLIKNGYVIGNENNKTVLTSPIDNSSMNNIEICVRFDNNDVMKRKVIAYIIK